MKPPILITGHDEFMAAWALRRIPHVGPHGFGPCKAIGVAKGTGPQDARLLAVVVFNCLDEQAKTLQISCASDSPMWAHPETIRELLRYPFEQLGCFMVWMAIPHTNERAIRFNKEGLGMKMAGPIRHVFGEGVHAVHMSMTRHEWARRWRNQDAEGRKGRSVATSAA
jgi:RimJ/RimL family protein N-acetyltransferase